GRRGAPRARAHPRPGPGHRRRRAVRRYRRQAPAAARRQPLRARRQRRVAGRAAPPAGPAGRPVIRLEPAGAEALLLVLAEQPTAELPLRIAALAERIRHELGPLLTDLVPGWTSLLLHYDLL